MPPRQRTKTTDTAPKAFPEVPAAPECCDLCFPAGIPDGFSSVGCEHGTWYAAPRLASGGPVRTGDLVQFGDGEPETLVPPPAD